MKTEIKFIIAMLVLLWTAAVLAQSAGGAGSGAAGSGSSGTSTSGATPGNISGNTGNSGNLRNSSTGNNATNLNTGYGTDMNSLSGPTSGAININPGGANTMPGATSITGSYTRPYELYQQTTRPANTRTSTNLFPFDNGTIATPTDSPTPIPSATSPVR